MIQSWDAARAELNGPGPQSLNIGWAASDRHVAAGRGGESALRTLTPSGEVSDLTYGQLAEASSRLASALLHKGLRRGEVVAIFANRSPVFVITALAVWKAGGVVAPLYPFLGPAPLRARLQLSQARILVVEQAGLAQAIEAAAETPELRQILVLDEDASPAHSHAQAHAHPQAHPLPKTSKDILSFPALIAEGDPVDPALTDASATSAGDLAVIHFTSGTTGTPKAAVHNHDLVRSVLTSARRLLDLDPHDVYLCTADPGWVTGTSYGLIAPLVAGSTLLIDNGPVEPARWLSLLRDHQVTVFYTTPIRSIMSMGTAHARSFRPLALRLAATVGEPLNSEAVSWVRAALGVPLANSWWQTETGSIVIGDCPGQPSRPGAMGKPLEGFTVALVRRLADGGITILDEPSASGELALRTPWPSLFQNYIGDPARYEQSFSDGWYLSGDLARRDTDGFYWFLGRSDDVINSNARLIGPFEVEDALLSHPAVSEAAVVGRPDPVLGEAVTAFIQVNPGFLAGELLRQEILSYGMETLGPLLAPRDIIFVPVLPRTGSGKILRRVLKAQAVEE